MKLIIEQARNGFIVTKKDLEDTDNVTERFVFSEDEDALNSEIQCFLSVLYFVKEMLGPSTSRYSAERIHIGTEPGDKYEPPTQGSVYGDRSRNESTEREDYTDRSSDG